MSNDRGASGGVVLKIVEVSIVGEVAAKDDSSSRTCSRNSNSCSCDRSCY